MADLSTDARNRLKSSSFGLPGSRKYPMPDRAHAANAKARATQQVNKGNLAPATAAAIKAKANRILGKKRTGVDQDINNPTTLQDDINNWKSKPNTARPKWQNNSQGTGVATDSGQGKNAKGQAKFGGTNGGKRYSNGASSLDSMKSMVRDH